MPKGYQHLTYEQRYLICVLKKRGETHKQIAPAVGCCVRTLQRELKRNTGKRGYRPKQAHHLATSRKRQPKPHLQKMTPALIALITGKLNRQWSPEQISGWLKREHPQWAVSHESLYQYVWHNKKEGGFLYLHLRRYGKKYQKRSNGKTNRGRIIGRVDILERPEVVERRERFGDWEADTIVGKGRGSALVTVVERKSRYTQIVKVTRGTAEAVSKALIDCLQGLPVKTITFDNGKEFAYHLKVGNALGSQTYFATPYHSWERGLNENTNGLIRQYFPKGTCFENVSEAEVSRVEALLNSRPRKCLGYDTPERVLPLVA
jgi:transposase, IS30 family